jgi:hypothetical protein
MGKHCKCMASLEHLKPHNFNSKVWIKIPLHMNLQVQSILRARAKFCHESFPRVSNINFFYLVHMYITYLFYLGHLSLIGLQTKTRRQSNFSTFSLFTSYNPEWRPLLCMVLTSVHKKCLAQKVAQFGSLGWIPIFQPPFNSTCAALQYETETKFLHQAVPELHGIKTQKIFSTTAWSLIFAKFIKCWAIKSQGGECWLWSSRWRHSHPDASVLNSEESAERLVNG